MQAMELPYTLVDCGSNEWRFQESSSMFEATMKFDSVLEKYGGSSALTTALYSFLQERPDHIDALHHYASCISAARPLDGLAFSQMAVTIGTQVLSAQFVIGKDRLPTGFVQNRPFLRSLHGLMLGQRRMNLTEVAISTGEMCLKLDMEDRMGARESLAFYLVESGRDKTALALFDNPAYKDRFSGRVTYLHALVLIRLGHEEEALNVLRHCLHYYPQVARFILNKRLPQPQNNEPRGLIASGSEFEGWLDARRVGSEWWPNRAAMALLRKAATPLAKQGWKRYSYGLNTDCRLSKSSPSS